VAAPDPLPWEGREEERLEELLKELVEEVRRGGGEEEVEEDEEATVPSTCDRFTWEEEVELEEVEVEEVEGSGGSCLREEEEEGEEG